MNNKNTRKQIMKKIQSQNYDFTERQMKDNINFLREEGYIKSTDNVVIFSQYVLTEKGENYLESKNLIVKIYYGLKEIKSWCWLKN